MIHYRCSFERRLDVATPGRYRFVTENIRRARIAGVFCSILLLMVGCSDEAEFAYLPEQQPVLAEAGGEWVTVFERSMNSSKAVPEPFESESDSLRVITSMDALLSPFVPGLVVTNLLLRESSIPVASVRAEQVRSGVTTVDTTVVDVGEGDLSFFVAEQRGLTNWTVSVQEMR